MRSAAGTETGTMATTIRQLPKFLQTKRKWKGWVFTPGLITATRRTQGLPQVEIECRYRQPGFPQGADTQFRGQAPGVFRSCTLPL